MKVKYLIFSVAMTALTLVTAWGANILYRVVTRTPWSFEAFLFALLMTLTSLYFYNIAEQNDKED